MLLLLRIRLLTVKRAIILKASVPIGKYAAFIRKHGIPITIDKQEVTIPPRGNEIKIGI